MFYAILLKINDNRFMSNKITIKIFYAGTG